MVWRSSCRNRRASSPERMSGSVTISTSGVPPRLKSTSDASAPWIRPSAPPTWTVLAASSSRWARTIPTLRRPPRPARRGGPPRHSGWSYCEIWYALRQSPGRSSACGGRSARCAISQPRARPSLTVHSIARPVRYRAARRGARGRSGRCACSRRSPYAFSQRQNIFVLVFSWTWISSPTTVSHVMPPP